MITRKEAILNSRILHDNDEWTVAIPLTEEAAIFWGQGTDWSISKLSNNEFEKRNALAPQIIMIFHDARDKWLFRVNNKEVSITEHRGLKNESVDVDLHWHLVSDLLFAALSINKKTVPLIPEHHRNDRCLQIMNDLGITDSQKKKYKTTKSCLRHVRKDPGNIKNVPYGLLTEEICLAAVSANGDALSLIPVPYRTRPVCKAAVKKFPFAFSKIPTAFRDEELSEIAIAGALDLLHAVPPKVYSNEFFNRLAVKHDFYLVERLSNNPETAAFVTEELCLISANNTRGAQLNFVPKKFRTIDVCKAAVKVWGDNLEHVPANLIDAEMCLLAVQNDGHALEYVPMSLRSKSICLAAVTNAGKAVRYVPHNRLFDETLWLAAVSQDGEMLEYVPEHLRTDDIYLAAIKQNGTMLRLVPEYLAEGLIKIALKQNAEALEYVPDSLKTQAMCDNAVKRCFLALSHVPERFLNEELCWLALKNDPWAIQFMPKEAQTIEMCEFVYRIDSTFSRFMSDENKNIVQGKIPKQNWSTDGIYAELIGA